MGTNFQKGSCDNHCEPAVEAMLLSCVEKKIPNIPKGNPLAGKIFHMKRAKLIRQGMVQAGCLLPALERPEETAKPTMKPSKHNHLK